jgi:hypothetical protein
MRERGIRKWEVVRTKGREWAPPAAAVDFEEIEFPSFVLHSHFLTFWAPLSDASVQLRQLPIINHIMTGALD